MRIALGFFVLLGLAILGLGIHFVLGEQLKQALKSATSDDERDRLERQIAWVAGGVCTLWINVAPSADYQRQRRLIKESFRKLKNACGQR